MSFKIVMDSCGELPKEMKEDSLYQLIPLHLTAGNYEIEDDDTFDQKKFLEEIANTHECPRSSCPSPERYMKAYETEAERVYVITLSSKLSGSYNSAVLGKDLYAETYGEKQIHVFDSKSASCGETQLVFKILELEKEGLSFQEIVEKVEKYRDGINTYFVLDNLETLRKNGRLTGVKALVASTLSIKPVMGATPEGSIHQRGQAIGMKKALIKMSELIQKETVDPTEKILMVSHCNCLARAESFVEMVTSTIKFKRVLIMDTAGVSTMYANDGGIVVTV